MQAGTAGSVGGHAEDRDIGAGDWRTADVHRAGDSTERHALLDVARVDDRGDAAVADEEMPRESHAVARLAVRRQLPVGCRDSDQSQEDVDSELRHGDARGRERRGAEGFRHVRVGHAVRIELAAVGDHVADAVALVVRARRREERLAESVTRLEELDLAAAVEEFAEEDIDRRAAGVEDGRLDAHVASAGLQNVVGLDRHREIVVVGRGGKHEPEVGDHRARIQEVEDIVDAGGANDCWTAVAAVVEDVDRGVVGGRLDVERYRPLLEAVAIVADGAHQVGVDDLAAELADAAEIVALHGLDDDANLVVGDQEVADLAAALLAADAIGVVGDLHRRRAAADRSGAVLHDDQIIGIAVSGAGAASSHAVGIAGGGAGGAEQLGDGDRIRTLVLDLLDRFLGQLVDLVL